MEVHVEQYSMEDPKFKALDAEISLVIPKLLDSMETETKKTFPMLTTAKEIYLTSLKDIIDQLYDLKVSTVSSKQTIFFIIIIIKVD